MLENTSPYAIRVLSLAPTVVTALPVCDGSWHAVSATFSGGGGSQSITAFVDGFPVVNFSSMAVATSGSTSSGLTIGASGEAAAPAQFIGALSDVRIFNRALAPAEAVALGLPLIPSFAGATTAPAAGPGNSLYKYKCQPGYAGPSTQNYTMLPGGTWVYSGGAANCSICPAQTYPAVVTGVGTACTACNFIDPNAVAPAPGSAACTCPANFYQTGASPSFSCTVCPDGAIASPGASSCACGANFFSVGSGGSLTCLCQAGYNTFGTGTNKQCYLPCTSGTYSATQGGACVGCPPNSVSGVDARSCTCAANSVSNGLTGAALVCTPCPAGATNAGGAATSCACSGAWELYNNATNTCYTLPSPSSSITPSPTNTPTPSTTASTPAKGKPPPSAYHPPQSPSDPSPSPNCAL